MTRMPPPDWWRNAQRTDLIRLGSDLSRGVIIDPKTLAEIFDVLHTVAAEKTRMQGRNNRFSRRLDKLLADFGHLAEVNG